MHLALESGHGETAAILIEAGADRERVCRLGLMTDAMTHSSRTLKGRRLRRSRVSADKSKRGYWSILYPALDLVESDAQRLGRELG